MTARKLAAILAQALAIAVLANVLSWVISPSAGGAPGVVGAARAEL